MRKYAENFRILLYNIQEKLKNRYYLSEQMHLLFRLQSYTFSAIPATILQEKCKKSEE